jgi:acid phosphatase
MRPSTPHTRILASLLATAGLLAGASAHAQLPPPHDKVVVVIMENKSYDQARVQPYLASLGAGGAILTNSFGVARPSQPNYFALWAGNTLGISTNACPIPGSPYAFENLGHACEVNGKTWRAYVENLPSAGSTVCSADGNTTTGLYTRKHAPWTYFTNIDHMNERPYSELAAVLAAHALPNLSFIVPNNCHNSHNSSTPGCTLPDADAWLAANLPPIFAELGPNGLLILTWDEDDEASSNHIYTVLSGPKVIPGSIWAPLAQHYAITRLISDVLGLPLIGFGQLEQPILGIWNTPVPARGTSWGLMKTIYR